MPLLLLPTRRAQQKRICPAHPHSLSLHGTTGIRAARALPRTSPPSRAIHSMPSYPRHRASPTSAPTRAPVPRACTAGATPQHPYRVSLPPTRRSPSPTHRSKQAPKASHRQRRSSSPVPRTFHSELVGRLRASPPARSARPPPLLQPRARSARTPRRSRARARLADHAECLTCAGHVGMDNCRESAPDVGRAGRRVTGREVFAHLQGETVRSQG